MAIKNLNGEYEPSKFEIAQAPAALDHISETSENGHAEAQGVSHEVLGRLLRDYRRTTDSLMGADRDKRRVESKLQRRAERATLAGNGDASRVIKAKIEKMQRRGRPSR